MTDTKERAVLLRAVADEIARITTWLKAHGMRQVAMMIEKGEYK